MGRLRHKRVGISCSRSLWCIVSKDAGSNPSCFFTVTFSFPSRGGVYFPLPWVGLVHDWPWLSEYKESEMVVLLMGSFRFCFHSPSTWPCMWRSPGSPVRDSPCGEKDPGEWKSGPWRLIQGVPALRSSYVMQHHCRLPGSVLAGVRSRRQVSNPGTPCGAS